MTVATQSRIRMGVKSPAIQFWTAIYMVLPFVLLLSLPVLAHYHLITWLSVGFFPFWWLWRGFGVTGGLHRLLTHKSYQPVAPVKFVILLGAALTVQSWMVEWVSVHLKHHDHSDQKDDPHSPHAYGPGFFNEWIHGFYHAHVGWMIKGVTVEDEYGQGISKDKMVIWFDNRRWLWTISAFAAPALIEGLILRTWPAVISAVLVNGFGSIFFVQHGTWSINSLCHLTGQRPFNTNDQSHDLPGFYPVREWLNPLKAVTSVLACGHAFLTLGESFHEGHHRFAASAKHSLAYRLLSVFDLSYWIICFLEWLGLATKVVRIPEHKILEARTAQ